LSERRLSLQDPLRLPAKGRRLTLTWTRRVQSVRTDGRDVSTLYGREGRGGTRPSRLTRGGAVAKLTARAQTETHGAEWVLAARGVCRRPRRATAPTAPPRRSLTCVTPRASGSRACARSPQARPASCAAALSTARGVSERGARALARRRLRCLEACAVEVGDLEALKVLLVACPGSWKRGSCSRYRK